MKLEQSKSKRRLAVIVNYGCAGLFLMLFALGTYNGWNPLLLIALVATLITMLASFGRLHLRTRLWWLVHTRAEHLDERQVQITLDSLRVSYAIFSVIVLCILLYLGVTSTGDSMLILVFAVLLYLAHTLPSSVLAWREREI